MTEPQAPGGPGQSTYRRRRILVGAGALVVVILLVVVLGNLFGGDDDDAGPTTTTLPTEAIGQVVDRFQREPCSLLLPTEVEAEVDRVATRNGGGPEAVCTYDLDGEPAGDVITVQVSGPVDDDAYATAVAGATELEGEGTPFWRAGGGTGGSVLAHDGLVLVEVGVRLADRSDAELQRIGLSLLPAVLDRIPPTEPDPEGEEGAGNGAVGTCELVDEQQVGDALGARASEQPGSTADSCSFLAGTSYAQVTRQTEEIPALADIPTRSQTDQDGNESTWSRSEPDLGDEAVLFTFEDDSGDSADLYVLDGDALVRVAVTAFDGDAGEAAEALAAEALG